MGIDVKKIQVSIKRFPELFGKSCSTFVRKYPILSVVFLFFFLLYMFIPSLFIFIIFSIPILVFVAIAFRQIYKIHSQNLKIAKGEKREHPINSSQNQPSVVVEAKDVVVGSKRDRSSAIIQRLPGGRLNDNEKDQGIAKEDTKEENDTASSTTVKEKILIDNTPIEDDNPNEKSQVKVVSIADSAETSSTTSQKLDPPEEKKAKSDGRGSEAVSISSDDGGDEEGARVERSKVVDWTEDDQKNLMDLGNSEIERNKRLESLIAKRKARKLLSMQVRRTLMNLGNNDPCSQIPRVLVPRENPYAFNDSSSGQTSPVPGSAPSVLLPMHNPYDLPYDSQEEKPNLLGDSFDEDFRDPGPQKEMMFCRHESFSLGTFFPGPSEFDQSREPFFSHSFYSGQKTQEIPEYHTLKDQKGKEGSKQRVEKETLEEGQPSERESNHEDDGSRVHKEPSVTGSSSSSPSKTMVVEGERESQPEEVLYDRSPSSTEKERPNQSLFYIDKRGEDLTGRHSIASDLQVEISELGSPVLTEDENSSPVYRELKTSENDEDPWVAPKNLSGVEENESKSTEVDEVSEQDIIEVGFSRIKQDSDAPVNELNVPPEVNPGPSSPKDDVEVHNGYQHGTFSQDSVILPHENLSADAPQLTDQLEEDQPSYSTERSMEGSVKYDTDDQMSIAHNEADILDFTQSTYGEIPTLIGDIAGGISNSPPAIEEDTGNPENEHPHSSQHSEEVVNTSEVNHNEEGSDNLPGVSNLLDRREDISPPEVGSSNPTASVEPDVLAERGPTCSSSDSSLSSVAEEKELEISSEKTTREENLDQHLNVMVSTVNDIVNSGIIEEKVIGGYDLKPTGESSTSVIPQESVSDQAPTVLSASSSPMKEEMRLKSIENLCIEDQSEGMGDNEAVLVSNGQESFESHKGHDESRKPEDAKNSTREIGNLVPSQEVKEENLVVGASEVGTSTGGLNGGDEELNQSLVSEEAQPGETAEMAVEQVPIPSSSSSSPKSVLQKKFSVASFEQMVSVGIQRSEIDVEEISTRGELPPEDSTTTSPQSGLYSVDEAITPMFNGGESNNLEEPSTNQGNSVEEDGGTHNKNSASKLTSPTNKGAVEGESKHETSTNMQPPNIVNDGGIGGEVHELSSGVEGEPQHETSRDTQPPSTRSDGVLGGEVQELRSGPEDEPKHETSTESLPIEIVSDGGPQGEVHESRNGSKHETSRDSQPSIIASDGGEPKPSDIASDGDPGGEAQLLSIGVEEPKHETSTYTQPSNIVSEGGPSDKSQSIEAEEEEHKHETSTSLQLLDIVVSEGGSEVEVLELGS